MAECNQCRRTLPADAVDGICPACLLGLARPAGSDRANEVTRDQQQSIDGNFPTAEQLNSKFSQYQVQELIGQGGMGAVYKSFQPSLDRAVAIKIMSSRIADDPSFAERFSREARTMARLNHQNIVNIYDYGQTGGFCYLVMEYVEGVNLRRAMRDGELSAEQALAIVPQVCEALQFAHDEGIVHRDIKPENILIDKRGRVKIADFGLAKLVEENSHNWTLTGSRQVLGTLNYMAPEQIEQPDKVDHRADIYSLGVVLYELLTGELPLGRFQLPGEKYSGHAALDEVVVRTLEKAPDRRFQKASEFKTAVEKARSSSGFRPLGPDRPEWKNYGPQATAAPFAPNAAQPNSAKNPGSDVRFRRVAFKIVNPWHGLTVTHGVLKATDDGLLIDYSRRENVFQSSLGSSNTVTFNYASILKADLVEGWSAHSIHLEMDSPKDHPGLPAEKPGNLKFAIERKNRDEARTAVNAIRNAIGMPLLAVSLEKPEVSQDRARHRVRWPARGVLLSGLINVSVLPLLIFTYLMLAPNFTVIPVATNETSESNHPGTPAQSVVSGESQQPFQSDAHDVSVIAANSTFTHSESVAVLVWPFVATVFCVAIGLLLISGAWCMAKLRHWGWALAMAILAILPLHPGFILGIPFGIWSLVELSRPANREQFGK